MGAHTVRPMPLPVIWSGFVLTIYGATRAFFGGHMLFVVTTAGGPTRLFALNSFDMTLGIGALLLGLAILKRTRLTLELMKSALAAFVFYELGRNLGLAAADFDMEVWQFISNGILICVLASVWMSAGSVAHFLRD